MHLLRSSIGIRLEAWRLVIVLGCVAGLLSGCEEFQKELKKTSAELERLAAVLPKAPNQPPDRSQPSSPGGATSRPGQPGQPGGTPPRPGIPQDPSSFPQSSQALGDPQFGRPTIRRVLGHPTLAAESLPERNAVRRYIDYFNPDLLEKSPECLVAYHVPQAERAKFINDRSNQMLNAKPEYYNTVISKREFWKGANEFEQARSRKAFLDEYRTRFREAVIQLPAYVVIAKKTSLGYNFDQARFEIWLGGDSTQYRYDANALHIKEYGFCGELNYAASGFLKPNIQRERHKIAWEVPSAQAEGIVTRLVDSQAYWGMVVELQKFSAPGTKQGPYEAVEVQATIKSIGLYEDPDLERLIKQFDGSTEGTLPQTASQQPSANPSSPPNPEIPTSSATAPLSMPPLAPSVHSSAAGNKEGASPVDANDWEKIADQPVVQGRWARYDLAVCLAFVYLPDNEGDKYVDPQIWQALKGVRYSGAGTGDRIGYSFDTILKWKGSNDFEQRRSRKAFIRAYMNQFKSIQEEIDNCDAKPDKARFGAGVVLRK